MNSLGNRGGEGRGGIKNKNNKNLAKHQIQCIILLLGSIDLLLLLPQIDHLEDIGMHVLKRIRPTSSYSLRPSNVCMIHNLLISVVLKNIWVFWCLQIVLNMFTTLSAIHGELDILKLQRNLRAWTGFQEKTRHLNRYREIGIGGAGTELILDKEHTWSSRILQKIKMKEMLGYMQLIAVEKLLKSKPVRNYLFDLVLKWGKYDYQRHLERGKNCKWRILC